MPDEIAARQAGRATSALPLDCWVVAAVHKAPAAGDAQHIHQGRQHRWQATGVYLDVSQRGGAILDQQQLHARYPDAAQAFESTIQKVGVWIEALNANSRSQVIKNVLYW
jgi:hypothetical protein